MKRLNKITLILVAVMGIMISGCGSDIKKAPFILFEHKDSGYIIMVVNNLDIPKKESEKIYNKLKVKKIALLGKKECPLQDISKKSDDGSIVYAYQVKNRADCPPKDRLQVSYEITLNTNYGTFVYNIGGDNSTRRTKRIPFGEMTWYVPVNYNNKGGKK